MSRKFFLRVCDHIRCEKNHYRNPNTCGTRIESFDEFNTAIIGYPLEREKLGRYFPVPAAAKKKVVILSAVANKLVLMTLLYKQAKRVAALYLI